MKYFQEWKNNWVVLFKNLKLLIPDIAFIIFEILFAGVILWLSGLFPLIKTVYLDRDLGLIRNSLVRVIVSGLIFIVTSFILGAGIRAVKFNYIKDVVKNKKVDLGKFFVYSNKDIWSVIYVRILLFLVFLVLVISVGVISGLLSLFTPKDLIPFIAIFLLGLISIIYVFSVFFVYPIMFLKSKKAWDSIKLSFEFLRKKTGHVILVWLIVTLTGVAISYITRLSSNIYVVIPFNFIVGLFLGIWSLLYLFKAL